MSNRERAPIGAARISTRRHPPDGLRSLHRRGATAIRDFWCTLRLDATERRYQWRALRRLARGERLGTLGNEIEDEIETRQRGERWLASLVDLGLRKDHLCVEYGCGSLWCAQSVINYLQPDRFVGLDLTDRFYQLGRQRLNGLLTEKRTRLAVISRDSLQQVAALKPDFVYSHRVLHHVQRRGLGRYVNNLVSMLSDHSTLVIENIRQQQPDGSFKGRHYSAADIQRHLPRGWHCRQEPYGLVITRRS